MIRKLFIVLFILVALTFCVLLLTMHNPKVRGGFDKLVPVAKVLPIITLTPTTTISPAASISATATLKPSKIATGSPVPSFGKIK
jgi:hypothetical protein